MNEESLKERFIRQMKEGQKGRRKNFCQLCQKHCRDKNGMKCHLNSGRHKKQLMLFNKNPLKLIAERTEKFEKNFVMILDEIYQNQSISAKQVHSDYSKDIRNVSIFCTQWGNLDAFIFDLEKEGKLKVEYKEGEKFIMLLDTSKEAALLKEMKQKMERKKKKQLQKRQRKLKESLAIAEKISLMHKEKDKQIDHNIDKNYIKGSFSFKLQRKLNLFCIIFKAKTKKEAPEVNQQLPQFKSSKIIQKIIEINGEKFSVPMSAIKHKAFNLESQSQRTSKTSFKKKKSLSGLEILAQQFERKQKQELIEKYKNNKKQEKIIEEQKQQQLQEPEIDLKNTPWIVPGIVIKVKDKNLNNGEFYKKKGKIINIIDEFIAEIKILSKHKPCKLKIDQNYLETVIPKLGRKVVVLKPGPFQGQIGILESLHVDNYSGSIKLLDKDIALELPYELFSKLYDK